MISREILFLFHPDISPYLVLSAILSQLFPHRAYQPSCHNCFHIALFSHLVTTVSTSPSSAILSQLYPHRRYQPSCHNCFHIAVISHLVTTVSTSPSSAILSQLFPHRAYQPSCHNCFHIAVISHLVTTVSTSPLSAILSFSSATILLLHNPQNVTTKLGDTFFLPHTVAGL